MNRLHKASTNAHRYAVVTAAATFLLLIAGSLVTSTGSGLAVPDWPLSYGTWFPPMVGGILYEHGHRMIAGLVGLMIVGLAIWLWRSEPRAWVRRLGYAALAAVVAQALLGGLTVLLLLPPSVSIAHACLGQTVFCLTVALAWCTRPQWATVSGSVPSQAWRTLRASSLLVAEFAALQLVLGAIIRHTGATVWAHLMNGVLLIVAAGVLTGRLASLRREHPSLWRHALRLLLFLSLQVALGWMLISHRASLTLRTAHVGIGALVLAQAVILAWETIRSVAWPQGSSPVALSARTAIQGSRG